MANQQDIQSFVFRPFTLVGATCTLFRDGALIRGNTRETQFLAILLKAAPNTVAVERIYTVMYPNEAKLAATHRGIHRTLKGSIQSIKRQTLELLGDDHSWIIEGGRGFYRFRGRPKSGDATGPDTEMELEAEIHLPAAAGDLPLEALQLYRYGRECWAELTVAGLRKGLTLFLQVLEIAPDFAPAHAAIADTHCLLAWLSGDRPEHNWPQVKEYADRAEKLDPNCAGAHTALGTYYDGYLREMAAAEYHYKRGVELAKQAHRKAGGTEAEDALAHHYYGEFLARRRRFTEAAAQFESAVRISVRDDFALCMRSLAHVFARNAAESSNSLGLLTRLIERTPAFFLAHMVRGLIFERQRRYSDALADTQAAVSLTGRWPMALSWQATALIASGDVTSGKTIADTLARSSTYVPATLIARILASLDDLEGTLKYLARAEKENDQHLIFVPVDPAFERLLVLPDFQLRLRQLKLF